MRITLLLFLITIGCDPLPKESIQLNSESKTKKEELKQPRIYKINEDSLKTYIAGTEQFPTVEIKKADHSNKVLLRGPRPVIPGKSFLPQYEENRLLGKNPVKSKTPSITQIIGESLKNTPGEGAFLKPLIVKIEDLVIINLDSVKDFKERIIKNNKYTIQNGDTILPPLQVEVRDLPSSPAKAPSTKENSVLDVCYLNMEHGISQSQVRNVLETKDGNIWMTYPGNRLSRYNGLSFTDFG